MLLVDLKSELEISVKVIPNQLSKFIKSPNKNATIFPAMVLSSLDKGIAPIWVINLPRTIYIKEQFAMDRYHFLQFPEIDISFMSCSFHDPF